MNKIKRLISIIIILSIIIYSSYSLINCNSYAAQAISDDVANLNDSQYPGIKERIQALQAKYPNWKFKILYTDLDWNTVITNEYVHTSGGSRNYVQATANYQGAWICSACGYKDGLWRCASEEAIKYMMDPRNSLNASDIFQFEELTNSGYDMNVINRMTEGTFLKGYESIVAKAADTTGVNPYYIIGRMIQEQGTSGTALTSGVKIDDVAYYNPFNIQANGSDPISAGAIYAQGQGWDTLEKGIIGGINFLSNEYTKKGQNTLYLQKFDVESDHYGLYWHQYMQNIMAAQSEGTTLRKTYEKINAISTSHTFIIPVYKNMPASACARPNSSGTSVVTTDVVKVNVNSTIGLRDAPNGNRLNNTCLYKDEIVTRIEKATSKVAGTYWDKIRKADGTEAYVARETYDYEAEYKLYLVPVNDDNSNNNNTLPPETNDNTDNNFTTGENDEIIKKGDVNGDGQISPGDYVLIKNYILGTISLNDKQKKAADVNEDGQISPGDYVLVKNNILYCTAL